MNTKKIPQKTSGKSTGPHLLTSANAKQEGAQGQTQIA